MIGAHRREKLAQPCQGTAISSASMIFGEINNPSFVSIFWTDISIQAGPFCNRCSPTMAAPPVKEYKGITPPLSQALPTDAENKASNALIEELKRQNNYESTAATNKRFVEFQTTL